MLKGHGSGLRIGGLLAAIGLRALVAGARRYAIAGAKRLPRDATHPRHARCWRRPNSDSRAVIGCAVEAVRTDVAVSCQLTERRP